VRRAGAAEVALRERLGTAPGAGGLEEDGALVGVDAQPRHDARGKIGTGERAVREAVGGDEPLERWRAHLITDEHGHPSAMQRVGVVRGHLLLYEDVLAFAADIREDRMRGAPVTVVIPADSIRAVNRVPAGSRPDGANTGPDLPSRVMPRLRVDTDEGPVFFEAARAGRRADALAERYLGRTGAAR